MTVKPWLVAATAILAMRLAADMLGAAPMSITSPSLAISLTAYRLPFCVISVVYIMVSSCALVTSGAGKVLDSNAFFYFFIIYKNIPAFE